MYMYMYLIFPYVSRFWDPPQSELSDSLAGVKLNDDSVTVCAKLKDRGGQEAPLITPIVHASTYKVTSVQHYLDIVKDVREMSLYLTPNIYIYLSTF